MKKVNEIANAWSVSSKALAEKTSDAYSYDRYASWGACAAILLRRGFSEKEAEAILRSKWTRWAADSSEKPYGRATSNDLASFLDRGGFVPGHARVTELVAGTF